MRSSARLTQRDIARLAGVSQATVSLVLNGQGDTALSRIPAETREKVIKVIRETGYVADPIARRMVQRRNNILGVFTYEPVFPTEQADFFTPFLLGIEHGAQQHGYDLLLFTAAPTENGQRRIFTENSRLRLADGCLILGREFDRQELTQLVAGDYPFMAVGRRDDAGGPVPYVGADYAGATADLVRLAYSMGHRCFAYIGHREGAESSVDRWLGFAGACATAGASITCHQPADRKSVDLLSEIVTGGATVAFFEDLADAAVFERAARRAGLSFPADLSVVALGNPTRPAKERVDFTRFLIPREEMGRQAVAALTAALDGLPHEQQKLLPCDLVRGETLGPALNEKRKS